jgi:hypothetical protein
MKIQLCLNPILVLFLAKSTKLTKFTRVSEEHWELVEASGLFPACTKKSNCLKH